MSYRYNEAKSIRKATELSAEEQTYLVEQWGRLCSRENRNTPEYFFSQKPNGRFLEAKRVRIGASRYSGSEGGFWSVRYGNCKSWSFRKNPLGVYDAEPTDKLFSSVQLQTGIIVIIPETVHTKKEVLELAARLGFAL